MDLYTLFKTFPCWDCWHTPVYCDRCSHYIGYKMFILSVQMLTGHDNPFI